MNRRVLMLKQIAWNTFKTTGNINTMLELLEVDKTMDNIENGKNKINMQKNIINSSKDVEKEVRKWEL